MTAFGIRILGASWSIRSRRSIRPKRMSGEALTTHASLTMNLVVQFLDRRLGDGDTPMRELVDELRPARAGDFGGLRLRQLALRVPEQSRCDAHLLHELAWRQTERREGSFRQLERDCWHR